MLTEAIGLVPMETITHKRHDAHITSTQVITLVGAGGKTSAMYKMADELKSQGKTVLVTTTTKILIPGKEECDRVITDDVGKLMSYAEENMSEAGVTAFGMTYKEDKLSSPPLETLSHIIESNLYDVVLVEGDGSRRKSVKAPTSGEPVIPRETDKLIAVVGLSVISKPAVDDYVNRIDEFLKVTGLSWGENISVTDIIELIKHPEGLFRSGDNISEKYLLLTQMADVERKKDFNSILTRLSNEKWLTGIIGAELRNDMIYT